MLQTERANQKKKERLDKEKKIACAFTDVC